MRMLADCSVSSAVIISKIERCVCIVGTNTIQLLVLVIEFNF
jgi:hypothetical protein